MTCYNNDNNNPNLSAATEIFAEYGDFILTILRSKIHKDHQVDIDDLYQDLFLSFVAKPVPENVQNIKGYLYRAITNRIYNNTRGIERYRNLKKKYAKNYNNYINNDNPKNASLEERMERIFSIIRGRLSAPEIRAVTLKYKQGCSIDEIAKKMSVKKESVSRYISVGLKKIRNYTKQIKVY